MKTTNFLILFAVILLAFSSCLNDNTAKNISSTVANTENETRGINATKSFGKFSVDNTYLDLKIDGSFEASFEEGIIVNGKWSKEDNGKTLKLASEKSGDGKGKSFLKEFTILKFESDVIELVDRDGKKIKMTAEE
jgi:hypothetical protein